MDISIHYVYGYRSFDTRNNVKWGKGNIVVYHTAAIGVVYESEKNEQKHFLGHDADIVSLTTNSTGTIAATGQLPYKGKAKILIWEIESQELITCIEGFHTSAVRHVLLYL